MASTKFDNVFDAVTANQEESNKLQTCANLMLAIRDMQAVRKGNKQRRLKILISPASLPVM